VVRWSQELKFEVYSIAIVANYYLSNKINKCQVKLQSEGRLSMHSNYLNKDQYDFMVAL
jgi:hypothetical protein